MPLILKIVLKNRGILEKFTSGPAILILAESWVMGAVGEGGPGERDRRCQGDSAELQGRIHGVSGLPSPGMRHDKPALPWGDETK